MRPVTKQKFRRCLLSGFPALFSRGCCAGRSPPSWWKAGRARKRLGSVAEAELLSHLGVLLLPEEPIEELFRDFPAKQSEKWGRNTLSPDLAVYGALQAKEAALFLEYDGYYRHLEPAGIAADARKSKALLDSAPVGSYLLRIAHTHRELELSCEMGEVVIKSWQTGRETSLVKALRQVVQFLLMRHGSNLQPRLRTNLQNFMDNPAGTSRVEAFEFTEQVAVESKSCLDPARLHELLQLELGLSPSQAIELAGACPALARCDVEGKLKPLLQQLEAWGLNKAQAGKVFVRHPNILGYSIEKNLKPTVQWLRDVGVEQTEVATVIARYPRFLGCSVENNLKPTVQYLRDMGLTKAEVARVIARHPNLLGCNIEGNLQPTVQWFRDLGLTKTQVVHAIARSASLLGLSIEKNLKPTMQWFQDAGLTRTAVAKVVARCPSLLGRSIENDLQPKTQWLRELGMTRVEVANAISRFPTVLALGIENNLKLKVQWLRDLGLEKAEVARVFARFPQLFGLSLEGNLKPKLRLLSELFSSESVRFLLVKYPYMFSRSRERWVRRIQVLQKSGELVSFGPAMMLTDAKFAMRFQNISGCTVLRVSLSSLSCMR